MCIPHQHAELHIELMVNHQSHQSPNTHACQRIIMNVRGVDAEGGGNAMVTGAQSESRSQIYCRKVIAN